MTAVVTFTEDDLIAAVREYLAARGWTAERVEIDRLPDYEQADAIYCATAHVSAPKKPDAAPEPDPTILRPAKWRPREVTIPHGGYPVA